MQISSKEIISLIGLTSLIFLIAPLFLILYVSLYNRRKKKHLDEKAWLQKTYENELLKTQMEVQEQTLKNIAYDLHDNIGQLLSLITITLSSINIKETDKIPDKIELVEDLTNRSIKELKALSRLLHGEELIQRGLATAIEFELEFLKRTERFKINFDKSAYKPFTDENSKETIVFRLFQEIINNIIQHAQATEMFITLDVADNHFRLTISDNGAGFNVDEMLKLKTGMGLHNIKKRTALINGTASITSAPGSGSAVVITIPYS
jgi:signal transduction histidine kinase